MSSTTPRTLILTASLQGNMGKLISECRNILDFAAESDYGGGMCKAKYNHQHTNTNVSQAGCQSITH